MGHGCRICQSVAVGTAVGVAASSGSSHPAVVNVRKTNSPLIIPRVETPISCLNTHPSRTATPSRRHPQGAHSRAGYLDHPYQVASTKHGVPSGTRTPLFQANSAARYPRQAIIKQIEARTGRRLICFVSGSKCVINEDDTMPFVDLLHNVWPDESMELLLHTPGGNIDAAEKLIRMVRSKVGEAEFYIIVPEFAKSAGTLMVLGADRVVMSDMSELGPIDPQLPFPDSYGKVRWQTVQNYLDAYDEYTKTLTEQPGNVAAQVMLGKLDPAIVKLCQAVKERARQCAGDLLKRGMFREGGNWTLTVSELIDTNRWLSHSQMISLGGRPAS